ncbi:MAG: outer membrane beta-barrel protein [Steroidobacteraceae bacterium]
MKPRIASGIRAYGIRTIAVLAVAAAAWAANPAPALADATQGFSLGGGVGRYDIRINSPSSFANTIDNYSANDTAYQFFAQWRFTPYLALEGQYMNLGTNRTYFGRRSEITNKIDGWAPWLVGTLPIGSVTRSGVVGPFELFLKAGEYWYTYRSAFISPVGVYTSNSRTYNHFVYGGGLGLVFIQRLDVRLEYDELKIQDTDRSNALWLTGAFNF